MPKPHSYRQVRKKLKKHDRRFQEIVNRGKGSHRVFFHPDINGRAAQYPVKCHGEGTELSRDRIEHARSL